MKLATYLLGATLTFTAILPLAATAAPNPAATLLPAETQAASPMPDPVGHVSVQLTVIDYRGIAYGERASKIIGSTVYNQQKQAIGKVADLVINPSDAVSMVVVSVGGFLGVGSKDVAVSAKNFQFSQHRVVLPRATKQVLEQLPAFHFGK